MSMCNIWILARVRMCVRCGGHSGCVFLATAVGSFEVSRRLKNVFLEKDEEKSFHLGSVLRQLTFQNPLWRKKMLWPTLKSVNGDTVESLYCQVFAYEFFHLCWLQHHPSHTRQTRGLWADTVTEALSVVLCHDAAKSVFFTLNYMFPFRPGWYSNKRLMTLCK